MFSKKLKQKCVGQLAVISWRVFPDFGQKWKVSYVNFLLKYDNTAETNSCVLVEYQIGNNARKNVIQLFD